MAFQKFASVGIGFLLSFHVFFNFVEQVEAADYVLLSKTEKVALNDLFQAWKGTKNLGSRLLGWEDLTNKLSPNSDEDLPVDGSSQYDPCYFDPWRGVSCYIAPGVAGIFNANVVTITVSDESIEGILPDTIWNLFRLTSLILTGNPNLTGPIPPFNISEVGERWTLKNLDLHGNGFNDKIPENIGTVLIALEDLNLSNNKLEGGIPVTVRNLTKLWTLELSQNQLSGNISENLFQDLIKLATLDLSSNNFSGKHPNLTREGDLNRLNLSHNSFEGHIDLSATNAILSSLDFSDNLFTGLMPDFSSWSNLQFLNLSYNKFDPRDISDVLRNLTKGLQTLDLSNTGLYGTLKMSALKPFANLTTIQLDNNNIDGILNIADLISSQETVRLKHISLKNNTITTVIYNGSVGNLSLIPLLLGNPYCSDQAPKTDVSRCFCEQICFDSTAEAAVDIANAKRRTILIASLVSGLLLMIFVGIGIFFYLRSKRENQYRLLQVHEKFAKHELKPTLFSYSELQRATNDFHPSMKLGEGAFGAVFKGTLADGSVVAVKQLTTNAQQNMDDFLNEVVVLTTVKHRNLVKLKGCCLRGDRRLLIYECVENYDLAETLFEHKGNHPVTWAERFNICLGVAHGLHYLHEGVEPRIIHRDIKANNVLLDKNLQPKIADFGLALLFPNQDTHITIMQIAGTKGYMAPEYASLGQISERVDVFSFGVLVLEIVSGRRNINFDVPPDQAYLSEWAWRLFEAGRLEDLVDRSLLLQADEVAVLKRVTNVAMACLQVSVERRPSMGQVVAMLQGDIDDADVVRERFNGNMSRSHHALLGLNSSVTSLVPVDEESQVLHGSSSHGGSVGLELSVRAR